LNWRVPSDDDPQPADDAGPISEAAPRSGPVPERENLLQEAIEAEFETGRREDSDEEAKAHLLVRIARITGGTLLVLVGLLGFVLPVLPGWLLVIVGLGLLAQDVPFARRLRDQLRERLPQDEHGHLPKSTIVLMVVGTVVLIGASVWWTFLR
jgi:Putative transmembrane protein (PGPGW)